MNPAFARIRSMPSKRVQWAAKTIAGIGFKATSLARTIRTVAVLPNLFGLCLRGRMFSCEETEHRGRHQRMPPLITNTPDAGKIYQGAAGI